MTTTQPVRVLATASNKGAYDFSCGTKIVSRGSDHFIVVDEWDCDGLHGDCYRPFVYRLPAEVVEQAVDDLNRGSLFFQQATEPGEVDVCSFATAGGWVHAEKVSPKPYPRGYKSVYTA